MSVSSYVENQSRLQFGNTETSNAASSGGFPDPRDPMVTFPSTLSQAILLQELTEK